VEIHKWSQRYNSFEWQKVNFWLFSECTLYDEDGQVLTTLMYQIFASDVITHQYQTDWNYDLQWYRDPIHPISLWKLSMPKNINISNVMECDKVARNVI
jgi:hypothetical protein